MTNANKKYDESIHFPFGRDFEGLDGHRLVTINLSSTACKGVWLDDKTDDIVYDIAVQGQTVIGNAPAMSILQVLNIPAMPNHPTEIVYQNTHVIQFLGMNEQSQPEQMTEENKAHSVYLAYSSDKPLNPSPPRTGHLTLV